MTFVHLKITVSDFILIPKLSWWKPTVNQKSTITKQRHSSGAWPPWWLYREKSEAVTQACFLCGCGWGGYVHTTRAFGGSGWCCWSSSIIFYLRLWDWVSHWSWGSLIRQDWPASMPWGSVCPHISSTVTTCLCYCLTFFYVGACVWTWHLMFAWQALYWLSHLPNAPQFMFFNVLSLDHLQ